MKERIQQTPTYQGMNRFQKEFCLKKNNVESIRHGYQLSKNTSFDKWLKEWFPREQHIDIVKDLLNQD